VTLYRGLEGYFGMVQKPAIWGNIKTKDMR